MPSWFYVDSDKSRQGPIKEIDFIKLFQKKTITPDTLVWNGKTVKKWCKISSIEGVEDSIRNWKPGCGPLLKIAERPRNAQNKIKQQQQLDEKEVEKTPEFEENKVEPQSRKDQAPQAAGQKVDIGELQKQIGELTTRNHTLEETINNYESKLQHTCKKHEEEKSRIKDDKNNEWQALEAIIQTKTNVLDEKYSKFRENLESQVNKLELRLSSKVQEVEELKEKLKIEKIETANRLKVLTKEKDDLQTVVKRQETTESVTQPNQETVKNLEEELRMKLSALDEERSNFEKLKRESLDDSKIQQENTSGQTAGDWESLNQENNTLRRKNLSVTEEYRLFKEKMKSNITNLESKLSGKVKKINELKEKLESESKRQELDMVAKEQNAVEPVAKLETAELEKKWAKLSQEWKKLENERNCFKDQVKAFNEDKSKFEKLKHKELHQRKSIGQGVTSRTRKRVEVEKPKHGKFYWQLSSRWTWISIGLVSALGYSLITRALASEPKVSSKKYSAVGKKQKETLSKFLSVFSKEK